MSLINTFLEMG